MTGTSEPLDWSHEKDFDSRPPVATNQEDWEPPKYDRWNKPCGPFVTDGPIESGGGRGVDCGCGWGTFCEASEREDGGYVPPRLEDVPKGWTDR